MLPGFSGMPKPGGGSFGILFGGRSVVWGALGGGGAVGTVIATKEYQRR